ncbi:FkbM family methyltransferase [Synechococcus sp. CBW1107]|uniref:FkbM family methyltransferase n=1 Tax=Synechococcus sp. CBW1107 TaxID=2789857 RepID=UPI002AD2E462|nr:FkbM family methyltransferase [Synechococcus sp. CBW1107]CAK6696957.1 hypothetical protein IFHNHDMJ_02130 [Synechococcus sp. CBW1107]
MKIDVEGYEGSVLRGMVQSLTERRCRKVIVEVDQHRAAGLGVAFDPDLFMAQHGYRPSVEAAGRQHFDQCYLPQA